VAAGPVTLRARMNGAALPPGAAVLISIRPEKALLVEPAAPLPDDVNRIPGRVIESFFHGNAVRVAVDIRQREPFLVDMQLQRSLSGAAVPGPGEEVALAVHAASVSVFPDTGET
jgi:hypothetical protein